METASERPKTKSNIETRNREGMDEGTRAWNEASLMGQKRI